MNSYFPDRSGGVGCFDMGATDVALDPSQDDLLRLFLPLAFVVAPFSFGIVISLSVNLDEG